jgi:hypothetical protein
MTGKQCSSIVADSHLNHLGRFREAAENAGSVIGCSADIIHLVSEEDFAHALDRFKNSIIFSPIAVAITEFKIMKERLWTETFVNVENSLVQEYPEGVIAHEFAHIRQCYDHCCIPKLIFKNSCPTDARFFASVFIMELEEIVAEALLPSCWKNDKNRAILRFTEGCSEVPHPLFLAALKATTDFTKEDMKLFRKVVAKIERDSVFRFPFRTLLQYFRYFYIRRKIRIEDDIVIEEGINKILEKLFGIRRSCHVRMETLPSYYEEAV